MNRLDRFLGVHGQALALRSERMSILASNIANAATPGYKARDLDFARLMQAGKGARGAGAALAATSAGHITTPVQQAMPRIAYRVPVQPSLDGNTVELATEQLQFAETALRYRSTLSILNGRIGSLMSALKEQ
ncbi:flagellar basal body rod protein FlgB [Sandaracinobacteroides sp. A072]|uniref:flagellar basal body rod protein FlgB n=1 Tax=Sandaracinobacteroides sp. A072 TaxID=3461146 RepID=UPI004041F44D